MNQIPDKHCFTKRLLDFLRLSKVADARVENAESFAQSSQNKLEVAEMSLPTQMPTNGVYRFGVTLAELKPGDCGTVKRLIGSTQGRLRLLELGLTPGVHIKVVRAAAFGGPLDILVRGYQLSLRLDEANGIWLDDEDAEDLSK